MSRRPRVAAIVQARYGSTRLRGKVLEPLAGRTMLAEVLDRCQRIAGVDVVCCAVADGVLNDPVAAEAERARAHVVRGPEDDVLGRYHAAACEVDADVIVRVTSDCPYVDPAVAGAVVALVTRDGFEYACNNMPPFWPHGLDCEAVVRPWLDRAAGEAAATDDREHVTLWIRRNTVVRRANLASPDPGLRGFRWTVDHGDDLALARDVFARLPDDGRRYDYRTTCDIITAEPDLLRRARYSTAAPRPVWSCEPRVLASVSQIAAGKLAA